MKYFFFLALAFVSLPALSVIDGTIISNHSFAQSVALTFKSDERSPQAEIYCSGTLVGPRLIATAAHCLKTGAKAMKVSLDEFSKRTWIFIGQTIYEPDLPMVTPQFKSLRVHIHPLNDSIYSDLALIELAADVDLSWWNISVAPLQIISPMQMGRMLTHVGYGQIVNGGVKGVKAWFTLPLREFNGYNGLGVGRTNEVGPSACHGDSGGSAYMEDDQGQLRLVGVTYSVSSHPCGKSATYFIPLTAKIIAWMKATQRPLFL